MASSEPPSGVRARRSAHRNGHSIAKRCTKAHISLDLGGVFVLQFRVIGVDVRQVEIEASGAEFLAGIQIHDLSLAFAEDRCPGAEVKSGVVAIVDTALNHGVVIGSRFAVVEVAAEDANVELEVGMCGLECGAAIVEQFLVFAAI